MGPPTQQDELFHGVADDDGDVVIINGRCRIQIHDRHRVVVVAGLPIAHFATGDRMAEAHAIVTLVEQGWARQTEVARAFNRTTRTVRRYQARFEEGGLAALGRPPGYPLGRPRLPRTRVDKVEQWRGQGISQREIARRLGVNDKAVRKLLRRLGWRPAASEQLEFGRTTADPNVSGAVGPAPAKASVDDISAAPAPRPRQGDVRAADPNLSVPRPRRPAAGTALSKASPPIADPNLSAEPWPPVTLDTDPSDRRVDRGLASMGLLDDAAPIFRTGKDVPGAGVLLAVPALVDSGAIDIARDVYGSIGPAFYGLRTTILTLLLMALLRIKRPEGLKEHAPAALGRLLGLDRAPEVKTLRRKLDRIAGLRRAADYGRALAQRRVESRGHALGFLYVDGHVRAYHGKREIPKTHLARMRIAMPATTDYWVNDAQGDPLFVVTTEANPGLVEMLPKIIEEARKLAGDRRLTVVFDRGGWSPKLFRQLIDDNVDILTYRKGASRRVPRARFALREAQMDGRKISYVLSDTNVAIAYREKNKPKRLKLRQVTRLDEVSGHQTPVLTSRRDLDTVEVAYRMFERWRQENFFKYMREEYALDALVDYGTEPANAERSVPNPARKKIAAEIKKAHAEFERVQAELGFEAMVNVETARRTMRGFKIANAGLRKRIFEVLKRITDLEKTRAKTPTRVPVRDLVQGDVVKLAVERKHLTDLLKMVGYQAEGDLLRMIANDYRRSDDEGRTLIQSVLTTSGDIEVDDRELRVALAPLSSPHRTKLLTQLCEQINETNTRFPGTQLVLRFAVKPEPSISPAFPGPRVPSTDQKPDIS